MSENTLTGKPDFPNLIDNTQREAFRNCPHKWYRAHIQHLAPATPSIHLHAGGAFARGLEVARRSFYSTGLNEAESVKLGWEALQEVYGDFDVANGYENHAKSLANMERAYEDYFFEYPLGKDKIKPIRLDSGGSGVEFSFSVPTEVMHPETGNPILYGGRFDMLGERDDSLFVVDEKTTGSLGSQWASQWDLNSQFTGYCMAARAFGYPVAGAIIRGIGLLKTKITHSQVVLYRSDWEIERWWKQLHRDLRMMVAQWEEDTGDGQGYDFALGAACNSYGGCGFKRICTSKTPEDWTGAPYYRIHKWSPLDQEAVKD